MKTQMETQTNTQKILIADRQMKTYGDTDKDMRRKKNKQINKQETNKKQTGHNQ